MKIKELVTTVMDAKYLIDQIDESMETNPDPNDTPVDYSWTKISDILKNLVAFIEETEVS